MFCLHRKSFAISQYFEKGKKLFKWIKLRRKRSYNRIKDKLDKICYLGWDLSLYTVLETSNRFRIFSKTFFFYFHFQLLLKNTTQELAILTSLWGIQHWLNVKFLVLWQILLASLVGWIIRETNITLLILLVVITLWLI